MAEILSPTELLSCMCLFPGPIRVLCEDNQVHQIEQLNQLVQSSSYGQGIVEYLSLWFTTWKTRGTCVSCQLTLTQLEWVGWDLACCKTFEEMFHVCVKKDLWQLLDWCYSVYPCTAPWPTLVKMYVKKGHLAAIQWLYRHHHLTNIKHGFHSSCKLGHLAVAQWLYQQNPVSLNHLIRACFACAKKGHLPVVQWLVGLCGTDPSLAEFRESLLQICCMKGRLEIVQWLHSMGEDIHATEEYAFRAACATGHMNVAQWIYQTIPPGQPVNIHAANDEAFEMACLYGHLPMAIWLYSLGARRIYLPERYARDVQVWLKQVNLIQVVDEA